MFDLLSVLLDENNREPIVLSDESGRKVAFEQVAVIPHRAPEGEDFPCAGTGEALYAILHPIDKMDGVEEDEALVFVFDDEDGRPTLKVVSDKCIANEVFDEYYKLLKKALKND